jgi:hypothetical protein
MTVESSNLGYFILLGVFTLGIVLYQRRQRSQWPPFAI